MVQFIEVTQVTASIQRPASGSQRTGLSFDHLQRKHTANYYPGNKRKGESLKLKNYLCSFHLSVTEEGVQNLPD